ncbi:MAG TPA: hypothetical protein VFL87_08005 [Thermoleophilaceae bacterium]|nr:hypothetical protein [Thermoleophilaceae bacterium]
MEGLRLSGRARLAAALAGLAAACLATAGPARADWQRGVAYTTYSANTYAAPASDASLARLAADGNSSVAIVVTRYMSDKFSNVVAPTSSTPTDASLLHAMQTARALGLAVTLKPQVDVMTGSWRGGIAPTDPAAWFASYEDTIDHYADLARQGGASMYEVGTELETMTVPAYTARWQQLIAGVRQRFGGRLTYAANWDEYQQVGFWPSLDYIGVDAYFRLADVSDQSVAALASAWTSRGYVAALRRASSIVGKPVLFTEIGYRSVVGATIHPGIWDSIADYDMQEQANAYEAAFEAFAGQPWFAGMHWWSWPAALPANGWNGDYTPTFKPAEAVMKSWNARLAPQSVAPGSAGPVAPAPPGASTQAVPSRPAAHMKPVRHHRVKKKRHRAHRRARKHQRIRAHGRARKHHRVRAHGRAHR